MNKVHSFFNKTENYLHQSFGIRIRAEIVRQLVGDPVDKRILDVGCGNGAITTQFISSNAITFLDLSENMIALVKQNIPENLYEKATFKIGSFSDVVLPGNYDYIFAIGLLAHVPSVSACIERISSLLEPNGQAIIQFSDYNRWLTRLNVLNAAKYEYRINKLRYEELESVMRQYGLIKQSEVRFSFILPGMGKLPDKFLYRFSRFIWLNRFLSRFGTDCIWVLKKNPRLWSL